MGLPDVPPGLAQIADDERDALIAQLEVGGIAAAVLVAEGRYFQGVEEPPVLPANGGTEPTDDALKPAHRLTSYLDWGIVLTAHPKIQSSIDEYLSSAGYGYSIRQAVSLAGKIWTRCDHVEGPEPEQSYDWREDDA